MTRLVEYIVRAIENTYIVEMAYDRKRFKDLVSNLAYQILENWLLIHYVSLSGDNGDLKQHWKDELWSYLDKILKAYLPMDRKKAITEVLFNWLEMNSNDDNNIYHMIANKFEKEHIDIESEYVAQSIKDWLEYGLDELIELLSVNKYKVDVKAYLDSI